MVRLLCAKDVAEYLSVSVATVRRMSERGDLPKPITLGNSKRWDRNALDRYLDEISGEADGYVDPDEALIHARENRKTHAL